MITTICIFALAIFGAIDAWLINKRISKVEDLVYGQMENAHYAAIQTECQTIWNVIEELKSNIEELKSNGEE